MAAGYAAKLACLIIKDQLGEQVERVCECLISRGPLAMPEIGNITQMPRPLLCSCLLVLIQHNCVQAFKSDDQENAESRLRYILNVNDTVLRACFPSFLQVVCEKAGNEGEDLALGLLQHGRLTLEQLMKRDAECSSLEDAHSQFKEAFTNLLRLRLVERCPKPEAVLGSSANADGRPTKKSRVSSKKRGAVTYETQVQRVIAAASPMEAERFRGPSRWYMEEDVPTSSAAPGDKRKLAAITSGSNSIDEKEVLWRVNYEECVKLLRHKACASHVNSTFGPDAKSVIEAMLEATRKTERLSKAAFSDPPLTLNDILILRADWTAPVVRNALKRMVEEGFVNAVGDAGCHYTVAIQKIVDLSRKTEVESIVSQRFGKPCSRILRLLSKKGGAEQKMISEKCLIPDKEAWQLLFQLMRERYVELQEVPKTAGDRAPARTFYLWHVDFSKLSAVILEDMYHAAYNLHRQIEQRLEHEKELLIIPTSGALSPEQQQKLDRLQSIVKILEVSIFRLMGTVMLFDFY